MTVVVALSAAGVQQYFVFPSWIALCLLIGLVLGWSSHRWR